MSDRQLNYYGHEDEEDDDEERDSRYTRFDLIPSSDINKKEAQIYKRFDIQKPRVKFGSFHFDQGNAKDMIQAIDRPPDICVKVPYVKLGALDKPFERQSGKLICKAGIHAEAGVGGVRVENGVFEAEAKGPNISGRYEFSAYAKPEGPNASTGAEVGMGFGVVARAELVSVSAKVGSVGMKVALAVAVDTGASVGAGVVEAKVLGTGFSIGKRTSVSFLGSEVGVDCPFM